MAYPKGVRPRPNGKSIQISVQHRGCTHYQTLPIPPTPAGLKQAAQVREQWAQRIRLGIEEDVTQDVTFLEAAQQYLDAADVRHSTRNTYRDLINTYWLDALGRKPVASIRYRHLRQIDRATNWPGALLRKNAITALRRVFDYAVSEDMIPASPAAQMRVRRIQRRAGPDPYSSTERALILAWIDAHAPAHAQLTTHLAFGTGMRTGELLALRWEDFDGEALTVQRARVRGQIVPTKTSTARRVLLGADLRARLTQHPDRFAGGWIVRTRQGEPYVYPGKAFRWYRMALEEAGVRKREGPYPWRHTYASIGLMRGVRPAWLARQLGHSLEVFWRTYATWIRGDEDREEMGRMDAALAETWQKERAG